MASQRTGWHMHGSSLEVLEDDYCRCGDTVDRRPVILLDPAGLAARDARVRAEALAPIEALAEAAEEWSARCMRDHDVPGAAVVHADRLRAAMEAKG